MVFYFFIYYLNLCVMKIKKISFKQVSEILSENEMKHVTGGYNGSGLCTVTCLRTGESYMMPYSTCEYNGRLNCGSGPFQCHNCPGD